MSLFQTAPVRRYLVEFNAGKCIIEGNLIKPDLRKGTIYMDQSDDQLLHFYWKERNSHAEPEDDIIIFPSEAKFVRVSQCTTGRVYMLKFNSSREKHFYWMQDKSEEKDDENANSVNEFIESPESMSADLDDSTSHAEIMRLLSGAESQDANITEENILEFLNSISRSRQRSRNEPRVRGTSTLREEVSRPVAEQQQQEQEHEHEPEREPEPTVAAPTSVDTPTAITAATATTTTTTTTDSAATANNASAGNNPDYAQLAQMLASMNGQRGPVQSLALTDILNSQTLTPLLNDPEVCESLVPYLPEESEKTAEEVRQVVRSPQFSQAVQSLTVALQTGQLGPLLSQLGLDPSAGYSVELFLNAIEKQAQEKSSNAMEED
ncbi:hypothetical protein RMCBS344292_17499 [Rhizopus microsporus]|nr:hypothetical protein RMCBS344292_17499 [Rhizopus microsporus]